MHGTDVPVHGAPLREGLVAHLALEGLLATVDHPLVFLQEPDPCKGHVAAGVVAPVRLFSGVDPEVLLEVIRAAFGDAADGATLVLPPVVDHVLVEVTVECTVCFFAFVEVSHLAYGPFFGVSSSILATLVKGFCPRLLTESNISAISIGLVALV